MQNLTIDLNRLRKLQIPNESQAMSYYAYLQPEGSAEGCFIGWSGEASQVRAAAKKKSTWLLNDRKPCPFMVYEIIYHLTG